MKKAAPKNLAIWLAVSVGFLAIFVFIGMLWYAGYSISYGYGLLAGLIIGLLVYTGSQLTFGWYLRVHMSKIFQTLNKGREKEKVDTQDAKLDRDVLYRLNIELMNWAKQTQNQIQELRKAENYRREFVGNVSHELKTPIFNIQGYVHTLLDGGMEDPEINKKYLEKAVKNIERLSAIVEDLEAISQLESGELKLSFERFDLTRLVNDVIESLEISARERHIELKMEKDKEGSFFAKGDIGRIRQVLTNLLSNSVKYGRDNGTTVIKLKDEDDHARVEVSDDGIGIAKEHLHRLFERFYRVDKSRSREQGGTGLGLSIVKHILEAHGQTISVDSEPGNGTTFYFTLSKP